MNSATLSRAADLSWRWHISLSTIFFDAGTANADSAAANFLRAMAVDGGGQFAYTVAGGSNLTLGQVATLPSAICKK